MALIRNTRSATPSPTLQEVVGVMTTAAAEVEMEDINAVKAEVIDNIRTLHTATRKTKGTASPVHRRQQEAYRKQNKSSSLPTGTDAEVRDGHLSPTFARIQSGTEAHTTMLPPPK